MPLKKLSRKNKKIIKKKLIKKSTKFIAKKSKNKKNYKRKKMIGGYYYILLINKISKEFTISNPNLTTQLTYNFSTLLNLKNSIQTNNIDNIEIQTNHIKNSNFINIKIIIDSKDYFSILFSSENVGNNNNLNYLNSEQLYSGSKLSVVDF